MKPDFPIQMVDLKRQYARIKDEIDISIQSVIDNTAFIRGTSGATICEKSCKVS